MPLSDKLADSQNPGGSGIGACYLVGEKRYAKELFNLLNADVEYIRQIMRRQ